MISRTSARPRRKQGMESEPFIPEYQGRRPRNASPKKSWMLEALLGLLALIVIAAVAAPPYLGHVDGPTIDPRAALFSHIKVAIAAFELDTGRCPTTTEGLQALLVAPPGITGWNGPYIEPGTTDEWGTPFIYESTAPDTFTLRSAGPDRIPGTADDIVAP
jgi:general secretion pathway protein G